jgi:cytochrome c
MGATMSSTQRVLHPSGLLLTLIKIPSIQLLAKKLISKFSKVCFWTTLMTCLAACGESKEVVAGQAAFQRNCGVCHDVSGKNEDLSGPPLKGVIGREVGAVRDYTYSEAMEDAEFIWVPGAVDAFIKNPRELLPGTEMGYWGMPDEATRKVIVAYLAYVGEH